MSEMAFDQLARSLPAAAQKMATTERLLSLAVTSKTTVSWQSLKVLYI